MKNKLWLLSCLCVFFFTQFSKAQINAPGNYTPRGIFDTIYDRNGGKYALRDLQTDTNKLYVGAPGSRVLASCNAGYFKLFFETGSGMDGTGSPDADRRAVLCQLFTDIAAFLPPPSGSPLASGTTSVNIFIRNIANVQNVPSGALGVASAFYVVPPVSSGIVDNQVWRTINSGTDSYVNTASPLSVQGGGSASGTYYYAFMAFDFTNQWNLSLTSLASGMDYDFYTVALHELTHALGFVSMINSNGGSRLTPYNYYSRYDLRLKNHTNTQNLITNTGSASLYNFGWNTSLSSSGILSPGAPSCNNGTTTCTSAVNYTYLGSSNTQAVYTTNCYQAGTSLSHFEDQCQVPSPLVAPQDNVYFVMSDITPYATNKRFLKPEERNVLCDLGYKVNTTYGNNTTVTGSYYNYGGSACNGSQVVGINDGITSSGIYTYTTTPGGSPINISLTGTNGVLLNDYFASSTSSDWKLEFPEDLYFSSSSSITLTSSAIVYTPPTAASGLSGVTMLRYIPYNQTTGIRGNITYIYVYVSNAACSSPSPCDIVKGGSYESATTCGTFYNTNGCLDNISGTPDMFMRSCTGPNSSNYATGSATLGTSPATDTHNGGSNNNFLGMCGIQYTTGGFYCEATQNTLASPLVPSSNYVLSFWAKTCNTQTSPSGLVPILGISSVQNTMAGVTLTQPFTSQVPGSVALVPDQSIPNDQQWHYFSIPFTFSGSVNHNSLILWNNCFTLPTPPTNNNTTYIFLDDVSIKPQSASVSFTPPSPVCLGSSLTNLHQYLSPATTGGSFSGPGVALSGSQYNYTPTATGFQTIQYTYVDNTGCTQSTYGQVNVVASGCTLPAGNTNNVATSYTTTVTNFGFSSAYTNPMLIMSNVTIGNGVSTNTVSITSSPDVRIGPGVKILVKSGATLSITNSWLHGCAQCNGGMWQGIEVEPGGFLEIKLSSIIEDALIAVNALATSSTPIPNLKINGAIFNKNDIGVKINTTGNNLQPLAANIITNCLFSCRSLNSTAANSTNFNAIKSALNTQTFTNYPTTLTIAQIRSRYGLYLSSLTNATAYKVGVTATTGNPEVNFFDNLDYGVYGNTSNLTIKNNIFQNCTGRNNSGTVTGIGICATDNGTSAVMTIGSTTTGESNTFRNNLRGVDITNYYKQYVVGNTFTNAFTDTWTNFTGSANTTGQYAVILKPRSSSASSELTVNYNTISNCTYGTYINRTVSFALGAVFQVNNNSMSATGTNYMTAGIFLEDASGNTPSGTGTISITGNTIVGMDWFGVLCNNIKKGLDINTNNELSVKEANPSGYTSGNARASIGLQFCQDATVQKNSLLKATSFTTTTNANNANADLYGIYITGSPGSIVTCNQVQNTSKAIAFEGSSGASANRTTRYEQNNHYYSNYGYVLQNSGVIGQQGSSTICMGNVYGNYGSQDISLYQTYVVNTTNANTASKIYVQSNTCGTTATTVTLPCDNGSIGGTAYSTGSSGINTSNCSGNTDLCGTGGGGSGRLIAPQEVEQEQDSLNTAMIMESMVSQLSDSSRDGNYTAELRWQQLKYIFEALQSNPALQTNETLAAFYQDNFNQPIGKLARVKNHIAEGQIFQALSLNNTIVPGNTIETNHQLANTLLLATLADSNYTYSDDEKATLFTIANQCLLQGGEATLQARTLYNHLSAQSDIVYATCETSGNGEAQRVISVTEESIAQQTTTEFRLFPNPNEGEFTIEQTAELAASLQVYTLNGKLVGKFHLKGLTNTINLSNLENGVYFYTINAGNKLLKRDKIVIIH